jgi:Concanavalin A-like lectin/glucanases superfamily
LKRFIVAAGMWLMMVGMAAAQTCPALVTAVSPSATSCWPTNITSGTTIPDTIDSNAGTLSGAYTLNQNGALACSNSVTGCSITTNQNYSNPQPMTVYADFAGTSGGILQLGPASSISAPPGYVLFLDNHGKLNFGAMNQGSPEVLQTPQPYADGNEHKAVISVGPAGMKIYVDGQEVAERNVQLANYASGSWFFGGINTANWPLSPSLQYFNGSLYAFAWWNGTQLTDQQGIAATGGNPAVIGNSYCTFTNQIASIDPSQTMAWANKNLTFTTIDQLQIPGGGSDLPIAPSTQVCKTDAHGNVLSGCQVPQGAHVNLSVGNGPPIPMVIPFSTSCDLTAIIMSQTDPPEVVSAVAVAGPLFNGTTVTNPPAGTIGTATITSPPSYQVTTGSPVTLNFSTNGNLQAVTMSASLPITLSGLADGAVFQVDTIENATGGYSPTFQVENNSACTATGTPWACCTGSGAGTCANDTLAWPANGSQPAMPSTAPDAHNVWSFFVEGTTVVGSISASSGGFPLSATANFNNYSGININSLALGDLGAPSGGAVTATCGGTCATTYTYELTCAGDINGSIPDQTLPSGSFTGTNAASLSSSNYNTLNWTAEPGCYGGYRVFGRISGALGLLATVPYGTTTYRDTGTPSPGVIPPIYQTTGALISGSTNELLNTNPALPLVRIDAPFTQTGDLLDLVNNGITRAAFTAMGNFVLMPSTALESGAYTYGGLQDAGSIQIFPAATPSAPTIVSGFTSGATDYYFCVGEDLNLHDTIPSAGTGTTSTTGTMSCGPTLGAVKYYLLRNNSSSVPSTTGSYLIGSCPTSGVSSCNISDAATSPTSFTPATINQTNQLTFIGTASGGASISVPAAAGTPVTLNLPTTNGAAGQYPQNDGSGNLSWATPFIEGAASLFWQGDGTAITGGVGPQWVPQNPVTLRAWELTIESAASGCGTPGVYELYINGVATSNGAITAANGTNHFGASLTPINVGALGTVSFLTTTNPSGCSSPPSNIQVVINYTHQ